MQNQGGNSGPGTPPFVPPPTPNAQPNQGVQDTGQGMQRIAGVKGYLANILYGVGEQMKSTVGLPTEDEQNQNDAASAAAQRKLAQGAQQTQAAIANHLIVAKQMQSPVTIPHPDTGQPVQLPFSLAHPYIAAQAKASGQPYMVVPNVGLYDTQAGKLTPDDIQAGITITQPIAQHFNLPLQSVGQKVPLGVLAQKEQQAAQTQVPSLTVPGANNDISGLSDLARPSGSQVPQSLQLLQSIKANGGTLPPDMQAMLDRATAPPVGAVPGQQPSAVPSSLTQPTGGQIPQSAQNNAAAAGPLRLATVNGKQVLLGSDGQPFQPPQSQQAQQAKKPNAFMQVLRNFGQGYAAAEYASLGIPSDLQKAQINARIGLETAQTGEINARTQAILNPPGKPTATALEYDKAGNLLGFRDQKGNLIGPNNPNLTPDMKDMFDLAEKRTNMPTTPEGQTFKYLVDNGKTPSEAFQFIQDTKQNAKPDTATQNKQAFQTVMAKVAGEAGNKLDPGVITDPRKMSAAITASQALTPAEKQSALSYLAANPTPASQALNVILRGSSYGQSKEFAVYDNVNKRSDYVSADELNRARAEEPGRYTPATFSPEAVGDRAVAKDLAAGKTKDQVVSFNALLGHVGDLNDGIEQLRNTGSPMINKPINWLKANAMGDPAVSNFIQRMEPVKKEYMSFLLNNRALYDEDRQSADKIMNENLSPAQMQENMKGFAHTAAIRLGAANDSYKRIKQGQDIPDLLSDEADSTLRALGVGIPGYKTPRTQPNTPPPDTRVQIGATASRQDGTKWKFKGGNSKDPNNWEQVK